MLKLLSRHRAPLLMIGLLLGGCRNDPAEESARPGVTDSGAGTHAQASSGDSTIGIDSGGKMTALPGATTGAEGVPTAPAIRVALVDSVRAFMSAVESGRKDRFWEMLSARSMEAAGTESGGTREEIWDAARETLGGLGHTQIRFIGGTADSVSLIVSRTTYQRVDSLETDTLEDPVIIHFLRERGAWKAIYPGLLYPERERRKR